MEARDYGGEQALGEAGNNDDDGDDGDGYQGGRNEGEKRRASARNVARGDCVRTSEAER